MSRSESTLVARMALAASTMLLAGVVQAATNSAQRVAQFAALPDWTGLWQMDMGAGPGGGPPPAQGAAGSAPGPGGAPGAPAGSAPAAGGAPTGGAPTFGPPRAALPYNAQWQAKINAYQAKLAAMTGEEQVPDNTVVECRWGMPRIFSGPYMFEVTVLPEQTFFNYDILEYRHIWTDGRKHPATSALKLTPTGHSIGHWEGATLVVDTVGIRPLWVDGEGSTFSEQAHIVERWSQPSPGHLKLEATVTDPVALTRPYVINRQFKQIKDTNRMLQQNCFEDIHEVKTDGRVITNFAPSKE